MATRHDVQERRRQRRIFFQNYAYAVFPTVGEGGFIVGAARGKGQVYVNEVHVGDTIMTS